MLFGNKIKKKKCPSCSTRINESYSFCPHCGSSMKNKEDEMRDYGMLGKADIIEPLAPSFGLEGNGITDKIISSMVNNLMRTLDKQMRNIEKDIGQPQIKNFPNGIRIQINGQPIFPNQQQPKKKREQPTIASVTPEQISRMSDLPRVEAKASVRRLSDRLIYELSVPGIASPEDVFVQKLESGYEIKAIGSSKVYTKSLPVNLPIRKFSINDNKLLVEFKSDNSVE